MAPRLSAMSTQVRGMSFARSTHFGGIAGTPASLVAPVGSTNARVSTGLALATDLAALFGRDAFLVGRASIFSRGAIDKL